MYDPYNPYEEKSPKIEINFKRNRITAKKAGIGTVNAGGAIIIIIFVVLCLTIFGLLSFATSFADKKLADKNLTNVSQYYKADAEAEKKLAVLVEYVNDRIKTETDFAFNSSFVETAVDKVGGMAAVDDNEAVTVLYRTALNTAQDAKVKFYLNSIVELRYDKNRNELTYKISEWKIMMESEFEYDENNLKVWSGSFDFD
jgi:hypothetical protein